jgi:hypothetical protein
MSARGKDNIATKTKLAAATAIPATMIHLIQESLRAT